MSLTKAISELSPFQQLITALFMIFTVASTGVNITEQHHDSVANTEFDVFQYYAENTVQPLMINALEHPTTANLRNAKNSIILEHRSWGNRHTGENKENYDLYLDACIAVIDAYKHDSNDKDVKIDEMNKVYDKLM